jgi:hypothetical protein
MTGGDLAEGAARFSSMPRSRPRWHTFLARVGPSLAGVKPCAMLYSRNVEFTRRQVSSISTALPRRGDASLLQVFSDLDGVSGEVEGCAQIHDGRVQDVPLWRRSILLRRRRAFERRARGQPPPSPSSRANTSTMAPRSLLSLQLKPE